MKPHPEPFPWARVMQFGFGTLKLASRDFWSLSLPELHAALQCHMSRQSTPTDRDALERLMARHPDTSCEVD